MTLIRFQIDLAIPEAIYNAIPTAKKMTVRDTIRELKALAVKINEGKDNEEMTVRAVWHRCHHDTGGSCEPEQEI
uniref:Uncharacterized protein n=1 Tax=viral metagenome TaxID=1070528 RepID=A0A6M3IR97_9ZZZZ